MPDLSWLADRLPQALLDHDRRAEGREPIPLTASLLMHTDIYRKERDRIVAVLAVLLAEREVRGDMPCAHTMGELRCQREAAHDLGHVFHSAYVADGHDASEGVQ